MTQTVTFKTRKNMKHLGAYLTHHVLWGSKITADGDCSHEIKRCLLLGRKVNLELTHWKRLWCWEGLGAGEEGDDKGWDGWMASRTRWTWVWVNSRSWWWTSRPGVLRFMGSQRVGHDWTTELNWTDETNDENIRKMLTINSMRTEILIVSVHPWPNSVS